MVETAGIKLRRARQLRQLSIEDASRATKIRVHQIADLEGDEYSNFANLAYAKSFLIAYGKYLHIDTRPYMDAFADASTFGVDDYQYLSETPVGVYRSTRRMPRSRVSRRKQLMAAGATIGVLTILLFGRLAYTTVQRLGDLDTLVARREARAHPGAPDAPATEAALENVPAVVPAASPSTPVELPALVAAPLPDPVPGDATAASSPPVPVPGDGAAVRELLGVPAAQRSAYSPPLPLIRGDEPQPQKIVNNAPRPTVN